MNKWIKNNFNYKNLNSSIQNNAYECNLHSTDSFTATGRFCTAWDYLEENILRIHPVLLEQHYYWFQQCWHCILLMVIFLSMEKLMVFIKN